MKKKWIDQVRRTRDKWEPTDNSVLCSKHFEDDCFELDSKFAKAMGLKRKVRLRPNASPTLFEKPASLKRKSSASEMSAPKRRKGAFEKRERSRVVATALECSDGAIGCCDAGTDSNSEMRFGVSDAGIQVAPACSDANTQFHTATRGKAVQTVIETADCAVQCSLLPAPPLILLQPLDEVDRDTDSDSETEETEVDESDADYLCSDETEESEGQGTQFHQHIKYIVFEECLLTLFEKCQKCRGSTTVTTRVNGTFLQIHQPCSSCGFVYTWDSQPCTKTTPAGNILLSAAILYCGALPAKTLRVLQVLGCASITRRTYFRHQRQYLQPSILSVWSKHQAESMKELKKEKRGLVLGGDGRADSPGHSAKFGSYTMMELKKRIVLDLQLVQSNEVKGSYHMEMEGLVRSIRLLKKKKFKIETVVTDRHKQIAKWIRENMAETNHYYDIWHMAKSLKKKIDPLAKLKDCELVGEWKRSLVNHLYWSAVSTPNGDGEMIQAKWLSLDNHIHNKHRGHGKPFPKCAHKNLKRAGRKKKWFKPHTKVSEKISSVIQNKYFCKDVKKLSPVHQTSICEAFHSVIINFAPKSSAFTYNGMLSRLHLAALHYNENSGRKQAETKEGEKRYALLYPKYKGGGHIVRKLMEECTFGYVDELLTKLWEIVENPGSVKTVRVTSPPPLCSAYEQPEKSKAINEHKSRFSEQ